MGNDYIELEIICADLPAILDKIADNGIVLQEVITSDFLTACCKCSPHDYRQINKIVEKQGGNVKVTTTSKADVVLSILKSRALLAIGLVVLILITLILPTRILFFKVEGNVRIPKNLILEEAAEFGIRFGASRRHVRSESVKNQLLGSIPDLQWVGINTSGCVAKISVREKSAADTNKNDSEAGSIIASRDGIVKSCTVMNGTAKCKPGQAVVQGQTLVSGYVDCGIAIKSVHAEGEIEAYTFHEIHAVALTEPLVRQASIHKKTNYGLLIGKKLINFRKWSGIYDATCVKMYAEHYLTLPGGFRLPIALVVQTEEYFATVNSNTSHNALLFDFGKSYLFSQLQAGQILSENVCFETGDGKDTFYGGYVCREMIGQFKEEVIVHEHGQTERANCKR